MNRKPPRRTREDVAVELFVAGLVALGVVWLLLRFLLYLERAWR
jgi:hypothetical protein